MAGFICRNCGHIQDSSGQRKGCLSDFWGISLILFILISLFLPVLWIGVGIILIIIILYNNSIKKNYCFGCMASNCMVTLNSSAGEQIYQNFYEEEVKNKE